MIALTGTSNIALTLVIIALGRSFAGVWFRALGFASAALVFAGVVSPLDMPVVDTANFFGYVLWSIWLVSFGVLVLVHDRRPVRTTIPAAVAS